MTESENASQNIIIVGSSIAGLRTAEEFSKRGFQTIVISPPQKEVKGFVQSTPFIRQSIGKEMGLPITGTPEVYTGRAGLRRRSFSAVNFGFRVAVSHALQNDPLVAVDYNKAQQRLLERVQQDGNIILLPEKFTDVVTENNAVVGIRVGDPGEEIRGVVIDATGRSGHVLAKLIEGAVETREVNDSSSIIGAYISLSEDVYTNFPHLKKDELIVDILPGGLFVICIPYQNDTSNVTHLLLIEGNSEKIHKALQIKAQTKTNVARRENVINSRWEAMAELLSGSVWEPVVQEVTKVHKVTNFTHKSSLARKPKMYGIVAIGDAAGHVNPFNGAGFWFINHDAKLLGALFSKWRGRIPDERILSIFNEIQEYRFDGRLRRAKRVHALVNLAHRMLGR